MTPSERRLAMVPPTGASHPPALAPAAGPAAGVLSPATVKCAFATKVAFDAHERATNALYAAEYALDEVNACQRRLDAARKQLTDAIKALRPYGNDLNAMVAAYLERDPSLRLTPTAVSVPSARAEGTKA